MKTLLFIIALALLTFVSYLAGYSFGSKPEVSNLLAVILVGCFFTAVTQLYLTKK